jgi:hypothetical protein
MKAKQESRQKRDRHTEGPEGGIVPRNLGQMPYQPETRPEDQQGIQDVEKNVGCVKKPRIQSAEPIIQRERKFREGHPISRVESRQHPPEGGPIEISDLKIPSNIILVVPIDEIIFQNGKVAKNHRQNQQTSANPGRAFRAPKKCRDSRL